MSQIRQRPIALKTAIMDAKQEDAYRETFRRTICEACGINDGTVVPAHFNLNAGGTGYRAKGIIAGLCWACHDIVDRRVRNEGRRMWILERLCQKLLRDRARAWVETLQRLHDAEAEIERLQALVRSGNDHDEDCDFLNLSGELTCNCSGGRARAKTSPKATEKPETD